MQKIFSAYYPLSKEQLSTLWKNCHFVLDANILLDLYRYHPETRDKWFDLLTKLADRIWLPHQSVLEYFINRHQVRHEQNCAYESAKKIILKVRDDAKQEIESKLKFRRHSTLNKNEIKTKIDNFFDKLQNEIGERSEHLTPSDDDFVLQKLTKLLHDKVGPPYTEEKLKEIRKSGDLRYQNQIPPGYKDATKDEKEKFGDLVLWFQCIDKAKQEIKPIIFVTNDDKEDWWWFVSQNKVGPRIELIEEMKKEADVGFHMYTAEQFMQYAGTYLELIIPEDSIEEVKEVRRTRVVSISDLMSQLRMFDEERNATLQSLSRLPTLELLGLNNFCEVAQLNATSAALAKQLQEHLRPVQEVLEKFQVSQIAQIAAPMESIARQYLEASRPAQEVLEKLRNTEFTNLAGIAKTITPIPNFGDLIKVSPPESQNHSKKDKDKAK